MKDMAPNRITPADYFDWWYVSGICPGDPTRLKNHLTLGEHLSKPGVTLILLGHLLKENSDVDDTVYTINSMIAAAPKLLSDAARTVGAVRLAEYFDHLDDPAAIQPESHSELRTLLQRFAATHSERLRGDMERHGDARTQPGFNKRAARKQVEELALQNRLKYYVFDDIPNLRSRLQALDSGLVGLLGNLTKVPFLLLGTISWLKYEFPRLAAQPQPPEVEQFFDECRKVIAKYPAFFPTHQGKTAPPRSTPTPSCQALTRDPGTLQRLRKIGAYTVESVGEWASLIWQHPAGIEVTFEPVTLTVHFQGQFDETILQAWDVVKSRLTHWLEEIEPLLVGRYQEFRRLHFGNLSPAVDGAILDHVEKVGVIILLTRCPSAAKTSIHIDVDWDDEHGCEFDIDASGCVNEAG